MLAPIVQISDLEKRVGLLKADYIGEHREAPIVLHLTRADELAMRADPPSFLEPEAAEKIVLGKLRVRKAIQSFLGLQIRWEARQTKVE